MANLFSLRDKIPVKQCVSLQEPLKGIWTSDAISDRFFSQRNVDYIQSQIQERIFWLKLLHCPVLIQQMFIQIIQTIIIFGFVKCC